MISNNDIIRRLRYVFDYSDEQMIEIFTSAEFETERWKISNWMKKDDNPEFMELTDPELAAFLNGLINTHRGKREGPQPAPENILNNNIIFRKLKIALALKAEDVVDIFELADLRVSKHEVNALFRHPDQSQYRECKDQFLRNFIFGLQLKFRGENTDEEE